MDAAMRPTKSLFSRKAATGVHFRKSMGPNRDDDPITAPASQKFIRLGSNQRRAARLSTRRRKRRRNDEIGRSRVQGTTERRSRKKEYPHKEKERHDSRTTFENAGEVRECHTKSVAPPTSVFNMADEDLTHATSLQRIYFANAQALSRAALVEVPMLIGAVTRNTDWLSTLPRLASRSQGKATSATLLCRGTWRLRNWYAKLEHGTNGCCVIC